MKKIILVSFLLVLVLGIYTLFEYMRFSDGKMHIVICNVGQGDGVFIRSPKGFEFLFDGGPDASILSCMSKHMPFWDRSVAGVFLSHPHLDHFKGFENVLVRYHVTHFYSEDLINTTSDYQNLRSVLEMKHMRELHLFVGDKLTVPDGVTFLVLGPSRAFLEKTSPNKIIAEKNELASLILHVQYKDFDLLLTGDSEVAGIEEALQELKTTALEVLQVPHHGSRSGLDVSVVSQLKPALATISVGKNRYGHPSKEILQILGDEDSKILRTDELGSIEIITDGKTWSVKTEK